MNFVLVPKQVTRCFALVVLGLVLAHCAGQFSRFFLGHGRLLGFVDMFNLDAEYNIPTLYAAGALLFCALLLALIGFVRKRERARFANHWLFLASIFLFLATDELLIIHEQLMVPTRNLLHTSGLLFAAWFIPYGVLLLILLMAYANFIVHLPPRIKWLFLLSGSIFVSGAIGMEMLGGRQYELYGHEDLLYVIYQTIEETLEMSGIVLFIYALTSYIDSEMGGLRIQIGGKAGSATEPWQIRTPELTMLSPAAQKVRGPGEKPAGR